jgi:hypothetical protein
MLSIPTKTENQSVTILTIKVDATARSFGKLFLINMNVRDPSVTPKPPGSIVMAPTMVENP